MFLLLYPINWSNTHAWLPFLRFWLICILQLLVTQINDNLNFVNWCKFGTQTHIQSLVSRKVKVKELLEHLQNTNFHFISLSPMAFKNWKPLKIGSPEKKIFDTALPNVEKQSPLKSSNLFSYLDLKIYYLWYINHLLCF